MNENSTVRKWGIAFKFFFIIAIVAIVPSIILVAGDVSRPGNPEGKGMTLLFLAFPWFFILTGLLVSYLGKKGAAYEAQQEVAGINQEVTSSQKKTYLSIVTIFILGIIAHFIINAWSTKMGFNDPSIPYDPNTYDLIKITNKVFGYISILNFILFIFIIARLKKIKSTIPSILNIIVVFALITEAALIFYNTIGVFFLNALFN